LSLVQREFLAEFGEDGVRYAFGLQVFREGGAVSGVAVDQEDLPRRPAEALYEGQQVVLVRVRGEGVLKHFGLPIDFPRFPPVPQEIACKYQHLATGPPDDDCQLVPAADLPACRQVRRH